MLKLFIVVNVDWFFLSHRLPIALEAKKRGYDVTIMAIEEEGKGEEIRRHGFRFIPLPSTRGGKNIVSDLKLTYFLAKIYKSEKPDIIHHVAIKPVIYGSFAARYAKAKKVINAISGMGSNFTSEGSPSLTTRIIKRLYKSSQSYKNIRLIVQNQDDQTIIKEMCQINDDRIHLIKGSGVDLDDFRYLEEVDSDALNVVLISRMLWDKGIAEFVEAAKLLKTKYQEKVRFILVGKVDPQNASSISETQLNAWNKEGDVEWIGYQKDVKNINEQSHIAVLPSYREGLPKSLIEALAIGRPIVTTDVPGCREVVQNGINGYLVPLKNGKKLGDAIDRLLKDKELRIRMGKEGRKMVEAEMSLKKILEKTFEIYESGQ